MRWFPLLAAACVAACAHQPPEPELPAVLPCPYDWAKDGTQSYETLCREPIAIKVKVKHILIGWKDLATPGRPQDPRAALRTYADAQQLARQLAEQLNRGEPIEPLMHDFSEDPGSASVGNAYDVTPSAGMVSEFKSLSMRLNMHEVGIVKSPFGLHVIQRVE